MNDPLIHRFDPIDLSSIVRYAGASGDLNAIHYDRDLAHSEGFPTPIAQGMLTAGLVAGVVAEVYGPTNVRGFGVRFVAPVHIGDEPVMECTPGDRSDIGRRYVLKLTVNERVVLTGWADIIDEKGNHD